MIRQRFGDAIRQEAVESLISRYGFKRKFYHSTLVWQVVVYSR